MARVYLDANILIDLVEKRGQITSKDLQIHQTFISPLSIHILMYVTKRKIPYPRLKHIISQFGQVIFDWTLTDKALSGPTSDFEDNVQLQSSAEADCDYFLTADQELLDMKFFGKVRVVSSL